MYLYKFIAWNTLSNNRLFSLFCLKIPSYNASKFVYIPQCKYNTHKATDENKESKILKDTTSIYNNIDDTNELHHKSEKVDNLFNEVTSINEMRFNEINLQMISNKIYKQIFGEEHKNLYMDSDISSIKQEFKKFGITTDDINELPHVDISIPKLEGQSIEEHFKEIAYKQVCPYLNIINDKLLNDLPQIPESFVLKEGWTRYSNSTYESIEYPQEDGLIYDVEVCIKNGPFPILATAASATAWYSWVSKHLIEETSSNFMKKVLTPDILIPLESSKYDKGSVLNRIQQMPKIIIGHNISYDRARIKEQYWLNASATRFLDTMALHICVSGTNSYQRAVLRSKNDSSLKNQLYSIASLNNLADVYKLYCGMELSKTKRSIFIDGDLYQIKKQFNESMLYCALDVLATHKVLKKLFPMFIKRFPHPATLAGMLELGSTYLPVNYNWKRYLKEAETTYEDMNLESKACLSRRADQVCRLLIDNRHKKDPWMWDEDWSIKTVNLKKGYETIYHKNKENLSATSEKPKLKVKFKYLDKTKHFLPNKIPHMVGYPNWYRKFCLNEEKNISLFPKLQNISTSMLITPKLLNLTWQNYPLHYIRNHGWGFLVPYKSENVNTKLPLKQILIQLNLNKNLSIHGNISLSKLPVNVDKDLLQNYLSNNFLNSMYKQSNSNRPDANLDNCCYFYKLPHKNGTLFNVGNPLAKDFLNKFSENILEGVDKNASRILQISKMCSYWKNNRDRILSQLIIWLNNEPNNVKCKQNVSNFGAIIPQVIVSGTLTRRAVEPTWMTASNAHCERIGSELRSMVSAPLNYSIIGADVDSQELWISSILGDAFSKTIKIQGGTPFSWMILIGNKSQGTDMHSVTAKAIGISRDQAKVINYARIYGAGQKFAQRLLKQFNPTISDQEAITKSKKMFSLTKGRKCYRLKKYYLSESFTDKLYTESEALKISKLHGKSKNEIFQKGQWVGGSESAMFNSLEEIAEQKQPVTPFLSSRLSRALEKEFDEKYLPTKINWVVQSAAVDFLHLILVNMRWLMKDKARLCLSFHDEVRYLVPSKYKYNAALALHVTNLLVRCFFVSRLRMKDLPLSVAFFTAVEVDSVLRKEATQDCITPSNPHGLEEGYSVHQGESLNIWDALEKSKGLVGVSTLNLKEK